ncbi:hypothetical protein [Spirosoma oryzicola]|uniref:hypothetical protein n=1 Tax=Spirosoma oryzicola TaxID=2898794 RepID=UPI001E36889D|nr:hypothetical protein [Spirosoma oryzicola]UHG94870.1 hypothetical protein LQ777_30045 [Spirosoma oryzicola]
MEKPINNKIDALRNEAENQEELMKSLAQIDEDGQLTDDALDAVSGGVGGDKPNISPIITGPIGFINNPTDFSSLSE